MIVQKRLQKVARRLALGGGTLLLAGDAIGLTSNMFAAVLVAMCAGIILFVGVCLA